MIVEQPHVFPKAKYNMTQASAALGIDRSTLRRYVSDGKAKAVVNKCNGRKMFYGHELIRIWGAEY